MKYKLLIISIIISSCRAQAGELTLLDQDLTNLTKTTQYEFVKFELFSLYVDFAAILGNSGMEIDKTFEEADNPLKKLSDLFQNPEKLKEANFDALRQAVIEKIQFIMSFLPRLSEYSYDKIKKIIEFTTLMHERLIQLNNAALWPDQAIFKVMQPLLQFIQEQIESVKKAYQEKKAEIDKKLEESESI